MTVKAGKVGVAITVILLYGCHGFIQKEGTLMDEFQRAALLDKVKTMPLDELNRLIKQAAEESGLTYEDVVSTDWKKFFEEMRADNG